MGGLLLIRTEEDKILRDYVADFFPVCKLIFFTLHYSVVYTNYKSQTTKNNWIGQIKRRRAPDKKYVKLFCM